VRVGEDPHPVEPTDPRAIAARSPASGTRVNGDGVKTARPRVTLISHVYREGYAGKLRELARFAELEVVLPRAYPTTHAPLERAVEEDDLFAVRSYPAWFPFWRKSSTRWTLLSHDLGFRRGQPQIVHVENERHSTIVLQSWTARNLFAPRARLVVFVWDNHRGGLPREKITVPLGKWMARRVDFFIAGNRDARDLLIQDGVDPARIVIAPATGVDLDVFRSPSVEEREALRAKLGIGVDDFVVGFVGRIEQEKGVRELGAALAGIAAGGSGPAVRWLLVGQGSLLEEVKELGGAGLGVVHVPPQRYQDVAQYYRAMDVLVLASRTTTAWKEQFGRVLVEAMASGVPVIGSTCGAIPEVIGDAGIVFPEGDVGGLRGAIERIMRSAPERRELEARGVARVREHYSDAAVARETAAVYQEVLRLPARKPVR
jgi:glycosyltransferase involved in cell wall biosynthesis